MVENYLQHWFYRFISIKKYKDQNNNIKKQASACSTIIINCINYKNDIVLIVLLISAFYYIHWDVIYKHLVALNKAKQSKLNH